MTKLCRQCNEENNDNNKFCLYCGFSFSQTDSFKKEERKNERDMPQYNYQRPIKDPTFAIILSLLVPGAGQIYLGEKNRGLTILAINFFGVPIGIIFILLIGLYTFSLNIMSMIILLGLSASILGLSVLIYAAIDTRRIYKEQEIIYSKKMRN